MNVSMLIETLRNILETEGDLEVDVSVAKQPGSKIPDQQYLVADARFVEVEVYDDPDKKRVSIRDWPY